jgi:hypothetical protein
MSLVYDNRAVSPGVHALIVGVSSYRHLPGGGGVQAAETYGLTQLSAAASTATAVYEWLATQSANLRVPLASCRLLLSPSGASLCGLWSAVSEAARCACVLASVP